MATLREQFGAPGGHGAPGAACGAVDASLAMRFHAAATPQLVYWRHARDTAWISPTLDATVNTLLFLDAHVEAARRPARLAAGNSLGS